MDDLEVTPNLETLTRAQLSELAAQKFGLTFKPSDTKPAILKAIQQASASESKYRVVRSIRHDGDRYLPGSIVALKDFQAGPLLNDRTIVVATEEVPL